MSDFKLPPALRAGAGVAVCVGRFGLIHAGTVAFLDAARGIRPQGPLVGAVWAPETAPSRASGLMAAEERVRVLKALRQVDDAALMDDANRWVDAAPDALWCVRAGADEEATAPLVAALRRRGAQVHAIACPGPTTAQLLERMAR